MRRLMASSRARRISRLASNKGLLDLKSFEAATTSADVKLACKS